MAQMWTLDASNEEEMHAALCQAKSIAEWRQWGEIAKQTVIPPQNIKKFPRSEMNELPNTPARPKPVAKLPGRSTKEVGERDLKKWTKIGKRKENQELEEWTAYHEQYFDHRGWFPCACERARLANPPDMTEITPSGGMNNAEIEERKKARALHKKERSECRTVNDRVGPLLQRWKRDKNANNFFVN